MARSPLFGGSFGVDIGRTRVYAVFVSDGRRKERCCDAKEMSKGASPEDDGMLDMVVPVS